MKRLELFEFEDFPWLPKAIRSGVTSEMGKFQRAIELYDLSLSIDNQEIRTYINKADAYESLNDFDKAEQVYQKALQIIELNELQLDDETRNKNKQRVMRNLKRMKTGKG